MAPGRPRRVELFDADGVFDDGVAVLARGPRTFTGEDTVEVTVHGNPLIVRRAVDGFVAAGARVALPGEFTRRAVLNGQLDLVAAEAVDQVIRATTPGGLRLGRAGLTGQLGEQIAPIREGLVAAAAELEARLDYPNDELGMLEDEQVLETLEEASRKCLHLAASYEGGRALVDGLRVALVGETNAGKSSLFNALLGRTRALVHSEPGTTRDVVEATCRIGPLEVTLLDTAGERPTQDPVEAAGLALAREHVDEADLLLVVLRSWPNGDTCSDGEQQLLERTQDRLRLVVYNGTDRPHSAAPPSGAVATSARTGSGVDALRAAIVDAVGVVDAGSDLMVASARQRACLLEVARCAREARMALPIAGVAVAADLVTHGLEAMDRLTGADTREDVLDEVFARFCIGK